MSTTKRKPIDHGIENLCIGFTGTQIGMSERQIKRLTQVLLYSNPNWFHHGDCIGADEQAHAVALALGIKVAIHPPSNSSKRAFCKGWKKRYPAKPYSDRNEDIVNETTLLLGAPKSDAEELRSGTWATMRYAWRMGFPVLVLER